MQIENRLHINNYEEAATKELCTLGNTPYHYSACELLRMQTRSRMRETSIPNPHPICEADIREANQLRPSAPHQGLKIGKYRRYFAKIVVSQSVRNR